MYPVLGRSVVRGTQDPVGSDRIRSRHGARIDADHDDGGVAGVHGAGVVRSRVTRVGDERPDRVVRVKVEDWDASG